MIVISSLTVRNARANAHTALLSGGSIEFYGGVMPEDDGTAAGDYAGGISLPSPAGDVDNGAFILQSNLTGMAMADVTITWARFRDAEGNRLYDMDCGLEGSGAALELDSVNVQTGGTITILSLMLIEP